MVDDVVNIGRLDAETASGTLSAERLAQQLRRSQIETPLVCGIHPAPRLRFLAAPVAARLMGGAVAVAHQHAAAGMTAGSERL